MITDERSRRAWLYIVLAAAGISAAYAHDRAAVDSNKDSMVDLAELQAVNPGVTAELFNSIDTDGNGLLSRAELRNGRASLHFAQLDQNHDGSVSFEEMQARFHKLTQERFQRVDADGNGLLSKEEMAAMHQRRHGKPRMHSARPGKDAGAETQSGQQQ